MRSLSLLRCLWLEAVIILCEVALFVSFFESLLVQPKLVPGTSVDMFIAIGVPIEGSTFSANKGYLNVAMKANCTRDC